MVVEASFPIPVLTGGVRHSHSIWSGTGAALKHGCHQCRLWLVMRNFQKEKGRCHAASRTHQTTPGCGRQEASSSNSKDNDEGGIAHLTLH
eukprot:74627-Chlamydomonas_euryale.AAC.13